ncbi:hypothetical protein BCV72DRAFT_238203 [Rhizopus microsporus var. microsporus]|uniref:Uncharacterized protein n=2 Tax=Rhizopus microsporus TaxID=58291 RepID=A0A2G4T033_RHIZD|nr:uncharacterized protein RHIMIDRAFT_236358 [Rhizopus microsporus ATCC 52813]ORE11311.1 hypothetical protein BCV72DRAFT_238203 [Rhizopus microsporus var. microsporus]PHZ14382.1 hypothetical protein RHIMIDRAFT_236358 [Rhizopus microsporus ATCC 52813]
MNNTYHYYPPFQSQVFINPFDPSYCSGDQPYYDQSNPNLSTMHRSRCNRRSNYNHYYEYDELCPDNEYYYDYPPNNWSIHDTSYYSHGPGYRQLRRARSSLPDIQAERHGPYHVNPSMPNTDIHAWMPSHSSHGAPMMDPMTQQLFLGTLPCTTSWPLIPPNPFDISPLVLPPFFPIIQSYSSTMGQASTLSSPNMASFQPPGALISPDVSSNAISSETMASNASSAEAQSSVETVKEDDGITNKSASESESSTTAHNQLGDPLVSQSRTRSQERRRSSIMESILSSLFLAHPTKIQHPKIENTSSFISLDDALLQAFKERQETYPVPLGQQRSASADAGKSKPISQLQLDLSRKTSQQLSRKAYELQKRKYVWCYKPTKDESETSDTEKDIFWTAFDVKNQKILDNKYAAENYKRTIKSQQKNDKGNDAKDLVERIKDLPPDAFVVLNAQSKITGPMVVAPYDGIAWYTDNSNNNLVHRLLQVATIALNENNKFVISNDLMSSDVSDKKSASNSGLRRSKSLNVFTSKLISAIAGY